MIRFEEGSTGFLDRLGRASGGEGAGRRGARPRIRYAYRACMDLSHRQSLRTCLCPGVLVGGYDEKLWPGLLAARRTNSPPFSDPCRPCRSSASGLPSPSRYGLAPTSRLAARTPSGSASPTLPRFPPLPPSPSSSAVLSPDNDSRNVISFYTVVRSENSLPALSV